MSIFREEAGGKTTLTEVAPVFLYIASQAGPVVRQPITSTALFSGIGLAHFPERGRPRRDDILPGLRTIGFEAARQSTLPRSQNAGWRSVSVVAYGGREGRAVRGDSRAICAKQIIGVTGIPAELRCQWIQFFTAAV